MKNIYILIFLFSNFIVIAQYNQGKIQFIDGTELIGLLKITKGDDVKFKKDADSKVIEYDDDLIKSFEFTENNVLRKFIYSETTHINNENSKTDKMHKLLEIIINGKISLFKYYSNINNMGFITYYLKKESDKLPIFYYAEGYFYKQKFIPFVSNYFSDCVDLVEKVKAKTKDFKHKDYKKVVEYYNKECK